MSQVMKILLLSPQSDAVREVVRSLENRGVAVLLAVSGDEAWQMLQLHGSSVELGIIHREDFNGAGSPGLSLIQKIKADAAQSDLPLILTTQSWKDSDCANHQKTPQGANAYLRAPLTSQSLLQTIEAVIGSLPPVEAPSSSSGMVLEDASQVYGASSPQTPTPLELSIQLEAFEDPSAPPAPPADAKSEAVVLESAQPAAQAPVFEARESIELSIESAQEISVESSIAISQDEPVAEVALPLEMPPPADVPIEVSLLQSLSLNEAQPAEDDPQVAQEMPYLFGANGSSNDSDKAARLEFSLPLGDAVVPGGAAHSPDLETLKKYLLLREQDVAALSKQLKSAREQVSAVEEALRTEKGRNVELSHTVDEQKRTIDDFERDKAISLEAIQNEVNELKFQLKAKMDKGRVLELQVREATDEMERLKERVRSDIRKIRVREKELENRLEIMKKDSAALIGATENKIIELKRKLDLLEFNMDLLQDQYSREREGSLKLREKLAKAAQVVRVAGGLLSAEQAEAVSIESSDSGHTGQAAS